MDRTTTRIGAALVALALSPAATAVEIFALHTDHAGSVVMETDKDRNITWQGQYEPYGLPRQAAPEGPGYTGHVHDAGSGLVYMQQRYYDPQVGRFLSVDPMGVDGGTAWNFNRYNYAANNPYRYTDPDGRCPNCITGAIAGGVGLVVGTGVNAYAQYNTKGSVDISDALIAGASAGVASAAIGFNPALAANPVVLGAISGAANVAGSIASDLANGDSVSASKAVTSGIAGVIAGSAGARIGDVIETSLGANASSLAGEFVGAVLGESVAAGLTAAGPVASDIAQGAANGVGMVRDAAREASDAAWKQVTPKQNRDRR